MEYEGDNETFRSFLSASLPLLLNCFALDVFILKKGCIGHRLSHCGASTCRQIAVADMEVGELHTDTLIFLSKNAMIARRRHPSVADLFEYDSHHGKESIWKVGSQLQSNKLYSTKVLPLLGDSLPQSTRCFLKMANP